MVLHLAENHGLFTNRDFLKVRIDHKLVHADSANDRVLFTTNQNVATIRQISPETVSIAKWDC